jgi:type I restriction enzyme M protein
MKKSSVNKQAQVVLINASTCGLLRRGGPRFKIDPETGRHTEELDNDLGENVEAFLKGTNAPGTYWVPVQEVFDKRVLVPRYYDERLVEGFRAFLKEEQVDYITLGDLIDTKIIVSRGGHGSPSNHMRNGSIPYVKVSDVRNLRVNVNPTNMVPRVVAETFWGGPTSELKAWDLITPIRASTNIGEFAIILPGEEERVLTKEFLVFRVVGGSEDGWDWAYLLWALCLKCVRTQWRKIALIQTNREDVGQRWREIMLPLPKDSGWANKVSAPFRDFFSTFSDIRRDFSARTAHSKFDFIASVRTAGEDVGAVEEPDSEIEDEGDDDDGGGA